MTQEEKAKAYDEALVRARKMLNMILDNELLGFPDQIREIFPQLRESEDERMLREIKRYIKEQGDKPTGLPNGTVAVSDMIAWLEKQKENSKLEDSWHKVADSFPDSTREVICKDAIGNFFIGRYYKGSNSWEVSMYDDINKSNEDNPPVVMWCDIPSEKQKEQKPISNPKWAELTWKDINELERIINNVHYEFQNGIGEDSFGELVLERFKEYKDDGSMDEQKPVKMEVYEIGKETTICGQDYKCKKDYKAGNCWYIKDVIYHCGRDGYLTDQNGVSWSCTPEWFNEYIQSNTEWAEEEKTRFVSGQFLQCKLSFDGFKEGEHYWLEYVGDDMYVGRSDNILNQKFHITPRQLFTLFSQELKEVQGPPQEEKQVSLNYEPLFNENPSDNEIIEALIKNLKEQDGFLTAIDCVSTKAILSWLEKHLNNNSLT